jgi:hypothetical protein
VPGAERFAARIDTAERRCRNRGDQFYGDCSAAVRDPGGNLWRIATHVEGGDGEGVFVARGTEIRKVALLPPDLLGIYASPWIGAASNERGQLVFMATVDDTGLEGVLVVATPGA